MLLIPSAAAAAAQTAGLTGYLLATTIATNTLSLPPAQVCMLYCIVLKSSRQEIIL